MRYIPGFFLFFFWIFGVGAFWIPGFSWGKETYTVQSIQVDVTAKSAVDARTEALAEAHQKAFQTLLETLVDEEQQAQFPAIPFSQIEPLVQDFEIVNERVSSTRYIATLNFRFYTQAVQDLLEQKISQRGGEGLMRGSLGEDSSSDSESVRKVSLGHRRMVILPVLVKDGQVLLWEETNPWFSVWSQMSPLPLASLEVPLGDLGDVSALSGQEVLEGAQEKLTAVMRRYGATIAVVSLVHWERGRPGKMEVIQYSHHGQINRIDEIELEEVKAEGIQPEGRGQVGSFPDQEKSPLWQAAVQHTLEAIQGFDQDVLASTQRTRLEVTIPFSSYKEWRSIKRDLEQTPSIHKIEVVRLSRQEALTQVTYQGTRKNLEATLARAHFVLTPEETGFQGMEGIGKDRSLSPSDAGEGGANAPLRWKLVQKPKPLNSSNPPSPFSGPPPLISPSSVISEEKIVVGGSASLSEPSLSSPSLSSSPPPLSSEKKSGIYPEENEVFTAEPLRLPS